MPTEEPGPTPAAPDETPVAADLEARAAAFDAEHAAPADAQAKGETPPTPDYPPEFKELLDGKYQGDLGALARGVIEQQNSAARLYEENERLRSTAPPPPAPPPDLDAQVAESPELKAIDQELQDTDAEITRVNQEQIRLAVEIGRLDKEIASLEGEARRADDDDKIVLRGRIDNLKGDRDTAKSDYQRNLSSIKTSIFNKSNLARQRRITERDIRAEVSRQERESRDQAATNLETNTTLMNSLNQQAETYGLDPKSDTFIVLAASTRAMLIERLLTMDPDGPGLDIPASVEMVFRNLADRMKVTPRRAFAHMSREKLAAAGRPAPSAPAATPTVKGSPQSQAEFWRARAASILGG
jgi:hypothetical protein